MLAPSEANFIATALPMPRASGTRAYDIAVRIKCSGYDAQNIVVRPDLDEAVAELNTTQGKKFVIANYTAVQPTRSALQRWIAHHGGAAHETN